MKIVDPSRARTGGASAHRPGGIAFTYLLEGEEFAPDNFCLMLVHVAERYTAPRHRHNFEQVRVVLAGRFGFGPGRVQQAGSIGYFSEGVAYTQDGDGPSTTLLLQVSGASGSGYMSEPQMRAGVATLATRGEFHDGIYTWHDAAGTTHNQDGYEAVWEHVFGRRLEYPAPRYDGPVLLDPARFAFVAEPERPGLAIKRLGAFHERDLRLEAWRLDPGARTAIGGDGRRCLGYVMAGEATTPGGEPIQTGFAIDAPAHDDPVELRAGPSGMELLRFVLPRFSNLRPAAAASA